MVESIWANGGNIAGLVDREDVRNCSYLISYLRKFCLCLYWIPFPVEIAYHYCALNELFGVFAGTDA